MAKRNKTVKDILDALNLKVEEVVQEIRNEIDNFRPILKDDINRVIKKNKDLLDIEKAGGKELIRELGVGSGGAADMDKIKNAWRGLEIDFPTGGARVTQLTFSKAKKKLGSTTINFSIDPTFYDLTLTNYENTGKNGPKLIPWMKWFIEGATTQGYDVKTIDSRPTTITNKISRFTTQIQKFSRTGEALMVKSKNGPFWSIKPRPQIWPQIQNEVSIQIEKSTLKFLKQITKRFSK